MAYVEAAELTEYLRSTIVADEVEIEMALQAAESAVNAICYRSFAVPTAATRMSAVRQRAGRSRVLEWAMVTVQFSANNSCAIGLPTMLDRPTMTAFRPVRSPN